MEIQDRETLERFARDHHVHYDVEPEAATQGGGQEVVGFDLRLLATHGESKLPAPGCPVCQELLGELRSFAERLVASAEAGEWSEIVPEPAALYESTEERGADEVALTLRIRRDEAGDHASGQASEDRRLTAMTHRLEELGVARRA